MTGKLAFNLKALMPAVVTWLRSGPGRTEHDEQQAKRIQDTADELPEAPAFTGEAADVQEMIFALRMYLELIESDLAQTVGLERPAYDSPAGYLFLYNTKEGRAFIRSDRARGELRRIWEAATEVAPELWRFVRPELAVSASQAALPLLSDEEKARHEAATKESDPPHVRALDLLRRNRDRILRIKGWMPPETPPPPPAKIFARAFFLASAHKERDAVRRTGVTARILRLHLTAAFPRRASQIAQLSDADIEAAVALWESSAPGRPSKGTASANKWETLAQFAKRVGPRVSAESLRQETRLLEKEPTEAWRLVEGTGTYEKYEQKSGRKRAKRHP